MAKILVIDDDPDISESTSLMLRSEGHEIEIELDDKCAMDHIDKFGPDLLVLDVMFPGNSTSGFNLARKIREKLENLPIVMISSINEQGSTKFGNQDIDPAWLPVSEFIEKPVNRDHLIKSVTRLLKK